MFDILLVITAFIIIWTMLWSYRRTRDPLHPSISLGMMLLYIHVARPAVLSWTGELDQFFADRGQLDVAQLVFTLGIAMLCAGMMLATRNYHPAPGQGIRFRVPDDIRQPFYRIGCVLGCIALAAYVYLVYRSGGFFAVYDSAKGYLRADSGYVGEAPQLAIPAVALLLLSWRGEARYRRHLYMAVLFSLPILVHGFLGARRGPTFLVLMTFLVCWYLVARKRPSLTAVMARIGVIGLVVLMLYSHRKEIYLGSSFDFDGAALANSVAPMEVNTGDEFIFPAGLIATAQHTGRHYLGARYAVTYLIRPIPRQLWPTKYEDLGVGWMVRQESVYGYADAEWIMAVGWQPLRGSAPGAIADLFVEFSWLGLFGCLLLGWFYGFVWRRAAIRGGIWVLLYVELAALAIYIPTQSVSAVFHRFLIMSIPTLLFWHFLVGPKLAKLARLMRLRAFHEAISGTAPTTAGAPLALGGSALVD